MPGIEALETDATQPIAQSGPIADLPVLVPERRSSTLSRHSRAQADGMSRRHIGQFKARLAD